MQKSGGPRSCLTTNLGNFSPPTPSLFYYSSVAERYLCPDAKLVERKGAEAAVEVGLQVGLVAPHLEQLVEELALLTRGGAQIRRKQSWLFFTVVVISGSGSGSGSILLLSVVLAVCESVFVSSRVVRACSFESSIADATAAMAPRR